MKKYVVAALTFFVIGIVFLIATTNKNPLHVYQVPENFTGQVEVTFEQSDSPPLQKERNAYIYTIPQSGKLKTSSTLKSGPVEVYYIDNQGTRKKVSHEQLHNVASTHSSDRGTTSTFFIGSKEQYENYLKQQ
ncbi:hypothetical protein [Paenibacillus sp. 32352]|uniref:DUF6843 domain-containing protein n=1 Tax=Paenibacillus sp. 32352 TaxID=1969111 RepID=UPI0009AD9BD7|nr:hypothetical protein [Paenibacillus sp. 32352]